MTVVKGIRDILAATPGVTEFISTYEGTPAIFTRRPVPEDAAEPYLLINGPLDVQDSGTFADPSAIQDEQRDLELVAKATGSVAAIDAAAEAMRAALANRLLTVPGRRRARCSILNGPRDFPADSDAYGRLMTINVHLVT